MKNIALIGIDLGKNSFHIHCQDQHGKAIYRKKFTRQKLYEFLATCPATTIVMEACGGAHFMVRKLSELGQSRGAINKSGSRPIEGVLDYTDKVPGKGLWIKDSPGFEPEILTGIAAAGAQGIVFSTGRGAPQGFPIVPVLKICGNPRTYQNLSHDMDVDAGQIILGNKSIEQVAEETMGTFMRVLSGELTKSEAINYNRTMDIHTYGPKI